MAPLLQRFPRIRRALPLLIVVVGVVVYFEAIAPRLPSEHTVVFRFESGTEQITKLVAVWTDVRSDEEPAAGSTLTFEAGTAPNHVTTHVRVPDGDFWLDLRIERGKKSTALRRKISLVDGQTTIYVPL